MIERKKKVVIKKKKVVKKKKDDPKNFNSQIKWGVDTLLTLVKDSKKKNSLIDDGESIFLQVSLFKIPQVDEMVKKRIILKHPPYAEKPEVCFIARDCIRRDGIKRTPDEMIDYTVELYENFFKKQKITGISTIMPYYQLKTEYYTYELRRKLVNRFDIFLCSSFLNSQDHFFSCLGKPFIRKNKYPISVKLPSLKAEYDPNANELVQSAIASSVFRIKEGSDNYCIKIGNTLNKKIEIKQNLRLVLDKVINSGLIPGGFENIRLMSLKSNKSKSVPLYISMDSGRNVRVPYVEPNVHVKQSVEGELSTLPGKKVTVLPDGQIFITPLEHGSDSEVGDDEGYDEDDFDDEEDEERQGDEDEDETSYSKSEKKSKKQVVKKKGKRSREDVSDDEDDDDDVEKSIESAEQNYLSSWNENLESSEDEESEVIDQKVMKKKQGVKGKPAKMVKKNAAPPAKKVEKTDIKMAKKIKKEGMSMKAKKEVVSPNATKKIKREVSTPIPVKKVKQDPAPAKKVKNEVISPPKKLKKGDTKPKINPIYGKLGKEKKKSNENQTMKGESLDEKLAKKKKMLDAKMEKKNKMAEAKQGKIKKKLEAKVMNKKEKVKMNVNGIEKTIKKTNVDKMKNKRMNK